MTRLTESFIVVINGPLATAGSKFNLLIIPGITVPTTEARLVVKNIDKLTINAKTGF